MHDIWIIDVSLASKSVVGRFQKNHHKEYVSCFNNLEKIKKLLNQGKKLAELEYHPSFFRHETNGIFRIGKNGLTGAKESRLYVYPCFRENVIYILGIGSKETQQSDLARAKKAIKGIC